MSTVDILAIGDHNFPDMAEWICDTHGSSSATSMPYHPALVPTEKDNLNSHDSRSGLMTEKETGMENSVGMGDIKMESQDKPKRSFDTSDDQTQIEQAPPEVHLKSEVNLPKRVRSTSPQSDVSHRAAKKVRVDERASGGPVGISRSAVATREAKAKMMSGEFQMDEDQLARFKQEILYLDPHADFLFGEKWKIYHSKCKKWYVMNEAYSAKIFRNHCNSAKGYNACQKKDGGSTKTIGNYFALGSKEKSKEKSERKFKETKSEPQPCGGITEAINPRVTVYLTRTGDDGGGAPSINAITKELYPNYKGHYSGLSAKRKAAIDKTQTHRRTWRIDRKQQAVYSTCCQKLVAEPLPSADSIYLCTKCASVDSSQAFKSALRRDVPSNQNFRFLNVKYKNDQLGLIFAKTKGLEDLFLEKVNHLVTLQKCCTELSVGHQGLCLCSIRPWCLKGKIQ
jgi:hypothetical protein